MTDTNDDLLVAAREAHPTGEARSDYVPELPGHTPEPRTRRARADAEPETIPGVEAPTIRKTRVALAGEHLTLDADLSGDDPEPILEISDGLGGALSVRLGVVAELRALLDAAEREATSQVRKRVVR